MASRNPAAKKDRIRHLVLVVDHDDATKNRVSQLLDRFDCQSLEAATALKGLAKAAELNPSLVVISADIPDMNIFELIRRFSSNAATAHIPTVALVSGADRRLGETCMRQGAAGCLFKPVDAEALFRTLEAALERNSRKMLRVRTVLPVKVLGEQHDAFYGAYTIALSSGGMFLRTMNPLAVNSQISLEFDLNGRAIAAGSVVVYNCQAGCGPNDETGIGLRFVDISARDKKYISDFVKDELMKGIAPPWMR